MNVENNVVDILDPQEVLKLGFELEIVESGHDDNTNSNLKEELIDKGWSELTKEKFYLGFVKVETGQNHWNYQVDLCEYMSLISGRA